MRGIVLSGKGLSVLFALTAAISAFAQEESLFLNPPKENRPETWFHFIGDNVSREGVEADLKAISQAGIGGIQWFHGAFGGRWPGVEHPVVPLSEEWDRMVEHMARTARDYQLRLTLQTCPGWAMAGGPWIEPSEAMRDLVWSRTDVPGGQSLRLFLPKGQPSDEPWRDYHDICVLAFPTPDGDTGKALTIQTIEETPHDWSKPGTYTLRFRVEEKAPIRTLELPSIESFDRGWCNEPGIRVRLKAFFPDGREQMLADAALPMASWQDIESFDLAVNEVEGASEYEFTLRHEHPINFGYVRFHSASRHNDWRSAAGRTLRSKEMYQRDARRSSASYVASKDIVDLSAMTGPDGLLVWDAPVSRAGSWTILRYGHVNLGYKNGPAPKEATGWECNKLDRRGARKQFGNYVGRLQSGPVAGLADGMLMDSWECYNQNWTQDMETRFGQYNRYPLRKWMPALSGYVLDNPETTARFLTDWRRTRSHLYNTEFFREMTEQAHEMGMQVQFETAAADVVAMDPLEYYKYADVPMCEFWHPLQDNFVGSLNFKPIKPTASAAHIYGKHRVAAESFTSFDLNWDEHWEMLKEVANLNTAEGVTHNVFHTYTHNPQVGFLPPGTSFGNSIGTPFLRGQTWWPYMPWFTRYLARISYMQECGKPVVDVLWYLGDEVGNKPDQLAPFPEGFKYDYCNPDVLLNRLEVVDGELCTPEGQRYRVLWIPENERMLPATVEKLERLVRDGAKVVAAPPLSPATLNLDAGSLKRFRKTIGRLWKEKGRIRRHGKGAVAWDVPLEQALRSFGLKPHLKADDPALLWSERETDRARWFFVAAPVGTSFHGSLELLAEGQAEYWDPVSGKIYSLETQQAGGRQRLRLDLERAQNAFIVFRKDGTAAPALPPALPKDHFLELKQWTLAFPEGWGAPEKLELSTLKAWKDLPVGEEGRAFSGTADYVTSFDWDGREGPVVLDLGRVDMIADVWVNGQRVDVLWASPYRMDIAPWLKTGANTLTVKVTSTWHNRLVYDASLSLEQRKTWTIAGPKADAPLRESGLLGPVRLYFFR